MHYLLRYLVPDTTEIQITKLKGIRMYLFSESR